jgi:hypothetical protein
MLPTSLEALHQACDVAHVPPQVLQRAFVVDVEVELVIVEEPFANARVTTGANAGAVDADALAPVARIISNSLGKRMSSKITL